MRDTGEIFVMDLDEALLSQYGIDGEVRLGTIASHLCGCSGSI